LLAAGPRAANRCLGGEKEMPPSVGVPTMVAREEGVGLCRRGDVEDVIEMAGMISTAMRLPVVPSNSL